MMTSYPSPVRDLIFAALRDGPKTIVQIAEYTGLGRGRIHSCLYGVSFRVRRVGKTYHLKPEVATNRPPD